VKHKIAVYFASFLLFGFLLAAVDATAQSVAYRQTNLASNLPATANTVNRNLVDPWGIAFLPGQTFFIADHAVGVSPLTTPPELASRPLLSRSRMPTGLGSPTPPESWPIRIHPLEGHRWSNL
jgi:hypothetical protein